MLARFLALFLAVFPLTAPLCSLGQVTSSSPKAAGESSSSKLVVPANTTIPLELKNSVSSRTAYVGQPIYCDTIYPITVGNRIVIPAGSYVKGAVTQVIRPGRVKGKAQLGLRFQSLTLPDGTTRAMRATLSGFAGNGNQGFRREESKIEGESSKGEDAAKIGTTAAQGTIIGGLSTRSGKGAGIGAISGGAAGLIWVLATRGKEIVLPPGTNFELELTAPLSLDRDEVEPPSRYQEGPALPRREPGS